MKNHQLGWWIPFYTCNLILFVRLEYTITNECNCKIIYGGIMMEYLSIKRTSEKKNTGPLHRGTYAKIGSYWAIPTDAEKPYGGVRK